MNTILVATDFSANAFWGTDYALELACQLHAHLIVLHAYDPVPNPTIAPDWMALKAGDQYEQSIKKLRQLRSQMQNATNLPVDISVVARPGSPATCLADEAINRKADLLVMGLVGEEPLKARQLGSLATDMIPRTKVPMLLVPPGAAYQKPHNIALAVDLSNSMDVVALSNAKQFAQLLDVTLDIICMEDEPDEPLQKVADRVCNFLDDQQHTFSFLSGNDLAIALEAYSAQHKTDIIMLLPKSHRRLRTFLLESATQEVARLATVPVLAVV